MVCSKPNAYGSNDSDVKYVRDASTDDSIGQSSLKSKKSIIRRLKKDKVWIELNTEYEQSLGVEAEDGQILLALETDAESAVAALESDDVDEASYQQGLDILKQFAEKIKRWQAPVQDGGFRSGATTDLEMHISRLLKAFTVDAKTSLEDPQTDTSSRSTALSTLESIIPIAKLSSHSKKCMQEASDLLTVWSDKDKVSSFFFCRRHHNAGPTE